jgi:hypothetical protein
VGDRKREMSSGAGRGKREEKKVFGSIWIFIKLGCGRKK